MTDVLIGPANYAGQATAFASAITSFTAHRGFSAMVRAPRSAVAFAADFELPLMRRMLDLRWRRRWRQRVLQEFGAVLIDGGLPLMSSGLAFSSTTRRLHESRAGLVRDLVDLRSHGIVPALLLHGSEIRDPDRHAQLEALSPFRSMAPAEVERLRHNVRSTRTAIEDTEATVFVTTPDLLADVPAATWVPVVVDPAPWATETAPNLALPTVVHAPLNPAMSGSEALDAELSELDRIGAIRYRRVTRMSHDTLREVIKCADVVVDKCSLGNYGAVAVEAMLAGRLVLGHVSPEIRARVEPAHGPLPIVEVTPSDIAQVLHDVMGRPEHYRLLAARGREYAERLHTGVTTAERLVGGLRLADRRGILADRAGAGTPAPAPLASDDA